MALVQAVLALRALGRDAQAARLLRAAERAAGTAPDALAVVGLAHGRAATGGSDLRLVRACRDLEL